VTARLKGLEWAPEPTGVRSGRVSYGKSREMVLVAPLQEALGLDFRQQL
jgi:hypothetical protein